MNKEKILELISQIENLFSELKLEILKVKGVTKSRRKIVSSLKAKGISETLTNKELLEKIKKTRINLENYPLIPDSAPVLIKALYVLDISKNELKVEGLSAAQISTVMPYFNKLKKESRQAIRLTLDSHKNLVNIRQESPKKIFYFIKKEGVKHYRDYAEKRENPAS